MHRCAHCTLHPAYYCGRQCQQRHWRVHKHTCQSRVAASDYVLVSQTEPRIEHYRRADDGSWVYRAAGPGQSVTLACGTTLPVDQLFAGVLTLPGD